MLGVKFTVTHDSLESMRAGKITELPNYAAIYEFFPKEIMLKTWASFGVSMATGSCSVAGDSLADRFPGFKAKSLSALVAECWGAK